jgi:hypothetical protein
MSAEFQICILIRLLEITTYFTCRHLIQTSVAKVKSFSLFALEGNSNSITRESQADRPGVILGFFFFFFFWDKVWLCSLGWPPTHNPPASAFQVLGLGVCTTVPG